MRRAARHRTVVVAARPAGASLAWEDAETIEREDDWAEVVFENGDAQVVDFAEKTHGPGLYELLDFRDGRKVDHVRMVARAKGDEARITLLIEK